jgi:hypothetical protein
VAPEALWLVASGLRSLQRFAAFCAVAPRNYSESCGGSDFIRKYARAALRTSRAPGTRRLDEENGDSDHNKASENSETSRRLRREGDNVMAFMEENGSLRRHTRADTLPD